MTILIYEDLVRQFENTLLTQLRGHHSDVEILEIWVPDPDPIKSIVNMVESVWLSDTVTLELQIRKSTLSIPQLNAIQIQLGDTTDITVHVADEVSFVLVFSQIDKATNISPTSSLEQVLELKASQEGRSLLITRKSEKVDSANFSGTIGDIEKTVMSAVCNAMTGCSLHEAVDHSVVYALESLVSNGTLQRPAGITLPSAIGPEMARAELLVKKIRYESVLVGQLKEGDWNYEDRGLSSEWVEKDREKKVAEVELHLQKFLLESSESTDSISVVEIDQHDRINVCFSETVPESRKPKVLRNFERYIRDQTGERLEVFVTELKDLSRIRRL